MPELGTYAEALLRVVDAVATGCACFTTEGMLIHESPSLRRALCAYPHSNCVMAEVGAIARLLGTCERAAGDESPRTGSVTHAIETGAGRYHLSASILPEGMLACEPTIIVAVTFTPAPERAATDLSKKFRLTPREVEIAHLLAEGDTNQGIADRLQLSVRTVHHHTERVLKKLGVRGRAAVASRISK